MAASRSSVGAGANPRNFGVKRLMKEWSEFTKATQLGSEQYFDAAPLEDNLFEWHFTIRGPPDSDFAGGRYHGRILLPSEYPFKPPDIVMLTPSGRFETNKKICLSISSFHPQNWQPSWSIRTVLTALIAFFTTPANGAIGSLDFSSHERVEYAARSSAWACELCEQTNEQMLPGSPTDATAKPTLDREVMETIAANKATAAVTTASQPATPALGPSASPPPTPIGITAAQRMMAEAGPSNPASPAFIRSFSEPLSGIPTATVGSLPPLDEIDASAAPTTPAASTTTSSASAVLSPLALDEGLRHRTHVAEAAAPAAVAAVPAAAALVAPAAAAVPAVAVAPPRPAQQMSVTVFLALLIVLILLRKLYASSQARQAFSFDSIAD